MGRFDFDKHGYNPTQVDKYINNLTLKYEEKLAEQKDRLISLKSELDMANASLNEYKAPSADSTGTRYLSMVWVSDYEDALTDLYMTQMRTENEALQEVIDKRKEALQAKKSYYEYDEKLKSQTKSINMLRAEIAALQGVRKFALSILIAGNSLEPYIATSLWNMGVCNLYKDWTISSEASNRGTFNDQWVMSVTHVGLQAIGSSKRIDYL